MAQWNLDFFLKDKEPLDYVFQSMIDSNLFKSYGIFLLIHSFVIQEIRSHSTAQAGLQFLGPSSLLTSASPVGGTTGEGQGAWWGCLLVSQWPK
jgi:hypothetical protein